MYLRTFSDTIKAQLKHYLQQTIIEISVKDFLNFSKTDIVLDKGPTTAPNSDYILIISGGIPQERFSATYTITTDDGLASEHWDGKQILRHTFNENGIFTLELNCGSCDKGHDLFGQIEFEYHSHTYLVNITFKD